ncbi:hypothetical protein N7448_001391 [Penicillium atrosanguineum]|uniref:uncharacterized protein n=1 Tax=Penicillium atrosanguineum TaxID=1132637 RepID=UPI00239947CA|nr:uncharacterized protein N7443_004788 [Penicillium atrosanguineum]KAJ5133591.1 hypothetical protein N7526_004956 [Penicillium atrosanguineum]KAJ5149813.1 hypothetical protein N7448_001391 [Penicillium atrosanguineum]KAJ5305128.1 hypothetical protein N7443_004788 [Penicillium atrosanguineum]
MVELRRSMRSRASRETPPEPETNIVTRSNRRNRATAASASITISRSQSHSSGEPGRSLRLTVKMPAGKMREATGGRPGRRSVNVFQEDPIVSGPRSSRNRKKVVEVPSSDDEDIEDQEEDEVEDEDAPGEDDEDADADGDVNMDDAPPQPPARRNAKVAAPARGKNVKSVEAKEMELEDEEDEEEDEEEEDGNVSDTESDAEGEPDDMDESAVPDVNVDDLDEEDEEDELDDELDSDALALDGGKQTKRQRGNLGDDFLQLPMEPQVKKHLTAEERIMRRAEMARRRKNLSEKRNEEEKMDTINRLLRKQPPKRRGRGAAVAADANDTTPGDQEAREPEKADPLMVRWVSGTKGCKVGVPEEWLGTPAGRVFGAPLAAPTGKMVEEV